jgi:hypothetical protein
MARRCIDALLITIATLLCASSAFAGQAAGAKPTGWNPPRTAGGQPDIQGNWQGTIQACNLETGICHEDGQALQGRKQTQKPVSAIVDPPDGKMPYQPWALAKREEMEKDEIRNSPRSLRDIAAVSLCLPGVPRVGGFQILQIPGFVVLHWERAHGYRVIPLNAGPPPGEGVKLLMGASRGRWEGTTLVIESTNFNDWSWLDSAAGFHSDAMRTVERITPIDRDTLDYKITVTDPKVFTRPWTISAPQRRAAPPSPRDEFNGEFLEDSCVEGNERNLTNMLRREKP